jgi:DNA-binding MarR family transcriptional regulator
MKTSAGTTTRWLTDEQQLVWRRYLEMQRRLNTALERQMQATGELSMPDFGVLVNLSEAEGEHLRVTDLARTLRWEKSRLSHQLTRMEKRGLITRRSCDHDGRGAHAVLTPDGRAALERVAPAHAEQVRRLLFDPLSPEQLAALGAACDAVLSSLDDTA